jgi:uncharacterized protein YjbI with pentapeptide repeats
MANPEHLAKLREGVEAWNSWRRERPDVGPNLSRADLRGVYLHGADLHVANLSEADLTGANLTVTDLTLANIGRATLHKAHLSWAVFSETVSRNEVSVAAARGADLSGADFSKAVIGWTTFTDVDLSKVVGLDSVIHEGPSSIGIDTFYRSHGKIPECFLRGCGISDTFIAFARSLVTAESVITFHSCFISYSTKDQAFAERLHTDLQNHGVRCWFAPHDIRAGRKIHEQIDEAIRIYDRLLLILSEHSMNSEWVKTEIAHARQKEVNEKRQVLFPISLAPFEKIRDWKCFDADTGKDSAREIRDYFIPDLSNWKDRESYQEAFQRLVRDLKAES